MNEIDIQRALNDFVDYLKSKSRSSATILAYKKDVEQLKDFVSKKNKLNLSQITKADIEEFRDSFAKQNYTAKSISRKLNAVKTFFLWLVQKKYIQTNPAAEVEHPRYENPAPRILTPMEYRALRDAAREDERISAIIELMLQTGVRISEVANLQLEDIRENELIIRPYESQPERTIPLNAAAKKAIDRYLKVRPQTKIKNVFVTKTGRPLLVRNIRSAIDRYLKDTQIKDAKVNDLRNTFIAHHLKEGVDVVVLSKIVGHKRLSTTERYLQFIDRSKPGKTTRLGEL